MSSPVIVRDRAVEIDGQHPLRSVFRLLGLHRRRVLAAVAVFPLKDSPQWLMPVVTARSAAGITE